VVTDAGLKWKEDSEGDAHRSGSLKIAVTELVTVEAVVAKPAPKAEPKPEPKPEPEPEPPAAVDEETGEVLDGVAEESPEPDELETPAEPETSAESGYVFDPNNVEECFGEWEDGHPDCLTCRDAVECEKKTSA